LLAVMVLTWMVFWMRKAARSLKAQLHDAIDNALNSSTNQAWALIAMVFFAVAREGLESVFFLLAAFQQDVGMAAPAGAVCGLAGAVIAGIVIYVGGIKLPLQAFFRWTAVFILFVAAGLAAGAIRAFHEAGLWNAFQDIAFDLSNVLSTHSLVGTLLEGLFGYQETPSISEVALYLLYLIPALTCFFYRPNSVTTAPTPAA
jgi:high-affinity iron transporter